MQDDIDNARDALCRQLHAHARDFSRIATKLEAAKTNAAIRACFNPLGEAQSAWKINNLCGRLSALLDSAAS